MSRCLLGLAVCGLTVAASPFARLSGQSLSPPDGTAAAPPAYAQQAAAQSGADAAEPAAALKRYCLGCHNARTKAGGLLLDSVDFSRVSAHTDVVEKVIRKLRTRAMPPPGSPRPDQAGYDRLAAWLENEIDREAAARPRPGRPEAIHRLNRAEFQNAVRDLLALDVDVSALLPADDMSFGFDNMGGLKMTPTLLERYLAAARHISRLAVASPDLPATAETFRLRPDLYQDDSFDTLPIGTRGGAAIRFHFPLDGEYVVNVEPLPGGTDTHQLEVSVDGARVQVFTMGPRGPAGLQGDGYGSADAGFETRLAVKAGSKLVAVTFVKKTSALAESLREPFLAPQAEGGQRLQPYVASVTITGPFAPGGAADTASRRRIFTCRPGGRAANAPRCAREILSTLARRAYRRPVTRADVDTLMTFYADGARTGFENGVEMALRRLLVSPEFLFRVESDPATAPADGVFRLPPLELASRLSFFLWSSIPDDELLDAAGNGSLATPGGLERQVARMLADPKAEALTVNFAAQWLYLRTLEGAAPDVYLFPNFGENLRRDFRRETDLFVQSLLRENRSVLDLVTADYTFLNERLARHYGVPNVYGSHFRRVTVQDDRRRGLLGHGSVLTLTSLADRTTVVGRGKWILENILGAPPPPPPANVPPLEENTTGRRPRSLRERMEQHRANPVCASCHARMDPLGFALENFDATGQWRTLEGGQPIDTSAALPDGTKFEGPAGLREYLLRYPEQIATAVTEKMLVYALGRGLEPTDASAIRRIVRDAAPGGYKIHALILGIVQSVPFQLRQVAPAQPASSAAANN